MKTQILLPLLAIAAASPAFAEPCSTVASRFMIAETLRLASEGRPITIAFQTRAEGVRIAAYLKEQYSDDMVIILQYQFTQLKVLDDRFEVVLRFKSIPERFTVPFAAVKELWDKTELKCWNG